MVPCPEKKHNNTVAHVRVCVISNLAGQYQVCMCNLPNGISFKSDVIVVVITVVLLVMSSLSSQSEHTSLSPYEENKAGLRQIIRQILIYDSG